MIYHILPLMFTLARLIVIAFAYARNAHFEKILLLPTDSVKAPIMKIYEVLWLSLKTVFNDLSYFELRCSPR